MEPNRPPIQTMAAAADPKAQTSLMGRFRNYFLTGLIIAGPVLITAWLIWAFITWVDNLVRPFVPPALRPETYLPVPIPGTGLIIAVIALTLLGFLTANLVGRKLLEAGEKILNRMPIVRPLYKTMKQIFETLFSKTGSGFRTVGLVEFPSPNMWSLVFVSHAPSSGIADKLPPSEHVSVFLPCTPNPTTGFFFYVPRRDVVELDISVESAMTLLISAGMAQPPDDPQKKLASLAAAAREEQTARSPVIAK